MNPRFAQAFNATPNTTPHTTCGDMDSAAAPTLAGTANHIGANVAQSHEWLDRIEMAVFGPCPASVGCSPPCPDGLESKMGYIQSESAGLSSRLSRLAEKIGG